MSEKLVHHGDRKEHIESAEAISRSKAHLEHLKHQAEQAEKLEHGRRNIEHLKHQAEKIAISRETHNPAAHQEKKPEPILGLQRELKSQAYKATMRRVRSHLKPTARAFSKIIHQPTIDAVSELGAKTVARPSAILGGGIVALIGSSFVLFMAKHYGFRYNFFVYIGFLIIGFIAGLGIEWFLHAAHRRKA